MDLEEYNEKQKFRWEKLKAKIDQQIFEQLYEPNPLFKFMYPDGVPPPAKIPWYKKPKQFWRWLMDKWPLCWKKNAHEHCDCEVW